MCGKQGQPASVTEALDLLGRALDYLNTTDAASLPSSVQAQALRSLECAGAKYTAARARLLTAFAGQAAYEDDGQGSARSWLKWQTRITVGACAQPASVCEIHHIIPRSRGGPTSLANLINLCVFHHKTAIHRWGWNLRLNPDGTTTATSPHGQRVLHSHSPPGQAA